MRTDVRHQGEQEHNPFFGSRLNGQQTVDPCSDGQRRRGFVAAGLSKAPVKGGAKMGVEVENGGLHLSLT
ncbi:MAG: hypothetical protein LBF79_00295 [Dysgonamonadaceae bacterium]|nr:hypothetical protein [Dysgonamonadaceae bacterium]